MSGEMERCGAFGVEWQDIGEEGAGVPLASPNAPLASPGRIGGGVPAYGGRGNGKILTDRVRGHFVNYYSPTILYLQGSTMS
jgi:hypothetical protein